VRFEISFDINLESNAANKPYQLVNWKKFIVWIVI